MATDLTASRLMVRHAAVNLDEQSPNVASVCAMAKLFATDHCFQVKMLKEKNIGKCTCSSFL